jgi:hypothetical protein
MPSGAAEASFEAVAEAAPMRVERTDRSMSFMGISLPGGSLDVVSPQLTLRLRHRAHPEPSSIPDACNSAP